MHARFVEALHASPIRMSLCVCGAGTGAIARLTQTPGCSRTLLKGDCLYSISATARELDYSPKHLVSATIAQQLAQHALHTSMSLMEEQHGEPVAIMGIGATSAIKTDRERRGEDQVFVSVWCKSSTADADADADDVVVRDFHLKLPRAWSRVEQDEHVTRVILHAIGQTVNEVQPHDIYRSFLPDVEAGAETREDAAAAAPVEKLWLSPVTCTQRASLSVCGSIQKVLDGLTPTVVFNQFGQIRSSVAPFSSEAEERRGAEVVRLLYPGSFRPLHWGHTELARAAGLAVAQQRLAKAISEGCNSTASFSPCQITYEISASIVDKGSVSAEELTQRVRQFLQRGERVAVTQAKLFVEKAALFPGHGFIVGVDTAKRILDPSYYPGHTIDAMVEALTRDIDSRGCYFVVGGRMSNASSTDRATTQGVWEDMSAVAVPPALQHLFISVPEAAFRVDVSSTELRARQDHAQPQ